MLMSSLGSKENKNKSHHIKEVTFFNVNVNVNTIIFYYDNNKNMANRFIILYLIFSSSLLSYN